MIIGVNTKDFKNKINSEHDGARYCSNSKKIFAPYILLSKVIRPQRKYDFAQKYNPENDGDKYKADERAKNILQPLAINWKYWIKNVADELWSVLTTIW